MKNVEILQGKARARINRAMLKTRQKTKISPLLDWIAFEFVRKEKPLKTVVEKKEHPSTFEAIHIHASAALKARCTGCLFPMLFLSIHFNESQSDCSLL